MLRVYSINGVEMKSEGCFVQDQEPIKKGEYKETELDKYKREVDFLITSIANRYEVTFNHKVALKENRSIKKSEYFDNIYYVTENALEKLKKQYSYACDL